MKTVDSEVIAVGFVRPPSDYGPAIAALSEPARAKMNELVAGGTPQADAIARAADWQNFQSDKAA